MKLGGGREGLQLVVGYVRLVADQHLAELIVITIPVSDSCSCIYVTITSITKCCILPYDKVHFGLNSSTCSWRRSLPV